MSTAEKNIGAMPLVVIVGSPRSGTSMLRMMFDAHPNVQIPTEFPFIPYFYPYFGQRRFREKEIDQFFGLIKKEIKYPFWSIDRWRIDFKKLRICLLEQSKVSLQYTSACKIVVAYFNSVFPKGEIKTLMLKEPLYTYKLKKINRIFPDIKYIALQRDPRGQVNSVRNQEFGSRLITVNAFAWNLAQKKILQFEKKYPGQILKVPYKELIADNKEIAKRICKFSGITFEETMLNYRDKKDEVVASYSVIERDWSKISYSSMQKPDPEKISAWKNTLSKREIKIIEVFNYSLMKKMGYTPKFKRNFFLLFLYIPVILHFVLQQLIGLCINLFPISMRLKIIFSPSLFEKTYGRLFGKRVKN